MDYKKEITLVITSCNRLHLLAKTIKSFDKFNTYPIKERIIIEDSGLTSVKDELNKLYGDTYKIIFNNPPLKQIGSIDRAYSEVTTEYIFHCEDDWEFYRSGFIEDSLTILEYDSKVKQVGLRSIQHDYVINHPTIVIDNKILTINSQNCYMFQMHPDFKDEDWVTCSFNPGLLRKYDYDLIGTYNSQANSEAGISLWYKNRGFYSIALENDAVKHIGWDESSMGHYKPIYKLMVRLKNVVKSIFNLFGGNFNYN